MVTQHAARASVFEEGVVDGRGVAVGGDVEQGGCHRCHAQPVDHDDVGFVQAAMRDFYARRRTGVAALDLGGDGDLRRKRAGQAVPPCGRRPDEHSGLADRCDRDPDSDACCAWMVDGPKRRLRLAHPRARGESTPHRMPVDAQRSRLCESDDAVVRGQVLRERGHAVSDAAGCPEVPCPEVPRREPQTCGCPEARNPSVWATGRSRGSVLVGMGRCRKCFGLTGAGVLH